MLIRLAAFTLYVASMFLASCSLMPRDYQTQELKVINPNLNVPEADYHDVTWLDEDTLAFVYRKPEFGDTLSDYRLALYTLSTEDWQDLPSPSEIDKCVNGVYFVNYLSKLPNGNLGFTYICRRDYGSSGLLYEWDRVLGEALLFIEYPPPFLIGDYAFSPDMSQWIQEGRNGDGLSNELYWVKQDEEPIRILANFKRVSAPAWSPDGNSVVLIGTDLHPEQPDGPQTWSDIKNLALYPWDLYRMDADGSNLRTIFPKIGRPYHIRWSNDEQQLFFAGRRPNREGGIWRLHLETDEIVLLWPYNTYFDLSPDQTKMVIIARETKDEIERSYPLIVASPEQ